MVGCGRRLAQPAVGPTQPASHILPEQGGTIRFLPLLLIKPGGTLDEFVDRRLRHSQSLGTEMVAQEIEASFDPSDEGLVGMLLQAAWNEDR